MGKRSIGDLVTHIYEYYFICLAAISWTDLVRCPRPWATLSTAVGNVVRGRGQRCTWAWTTNNSVFWHGEVAWGKGNTGHRQMGIHPHRFPLCSRWLKHSISSDHYASWHYSDFSTLMRSFLLNERGRKQARNMQRKIKKLAKRMNRLHLNGNASAGKTSCQRMRKMGRW